MRSTYVQIHSEGLRTGEVGFGEERFLAMLKLTRWVYCKSSSTFGARRGAYSEMLAFVKDARGCRLKSTSQFRTTNPSILVWERVRHAERLVSAKDASKCTLFLS